MVAVVEQVQQAYASSTSKVITSAVAPGVGDVYVLVLSRGSAGSDTSVTGLGATWTKEAVIAPTLPTVAFWVGRGATAAGDVTYTHALAQTGVMTLFHITGLPSSVVARPGEFTDFVATPFSGSHPKYITAAPVRFLNDSIAVGAGFVQSTATDPISMLTTGPWTFGNSVMWGSSNAWAKFGYSLGAAGTDYRLGIDAPAVTNTYRDAAWITLGGPVAPRLDETALAALTQSNPDRRLSQLALATLTQSNPGRRLDRATLEVLTNLSPDAERRLVATHLEVLTPAAAARMVAGWGLVIPPR